MYSKLNYFKQKTIILLMFFAAGMSVMAAGNRKHQTEVSGIERRATLTNIFTDLQIHTHYQFSYGEEVMADKNTYELTQNISDMKMVMDDLSEQANLSYSMEDMLVMVRKNESATTMQAQKKLIKGRVIDESKLPLPGVNILEEGTTNGVVTNLDGTFSIQLSGVSNNLVFSFIGYKDQVVLAQDDMSVQMEPEFEGLNEVVVVGYGSVKKTDVTGSLSKISEKSFRDGLNTSAENLIQGKVPGVRIVNSSGEPGAGVDVMIRGAGSIRSGNSPLFVIDGVPLSNEDVSPGGPNGGVGSSRARNPLNFLNPNDIESISVLKDASAAAIYGARGSNGVVLITTKKGLTQKPTFTMDSYVGVSQVAKKIDLLDGAKYAQVNPDQTYDSNVSTDWQDVMFRNAITTSNNLSFSNGTETGNYYVSLSHLDQEGIIQESNFSRLSGRVNVNESFLDDQRLRIKVNLTASQTKDNGIPNSENAGATGEVITHMLKANPTRPVYDENGNLFDFDTEGSYNPMYMLDFFDDETRTMRVLGNFEAKFRIIDGLEYQFNYGVDKSFSERNTTYYPNTTEIESIGAYYQQNYENYNYLLEHYLTFSRTFNSHHFDAMGGFSYQKFNRSGTTFGVKGIDDKSINPANNPGVGSDQQAVETVGFAEENELQSVFGRVNYNYKSKYLLTASLRADGSTRFGENNKYGYFPSFALGWNLSKESFLENSSLIDNLKLRGSWGQTGNQEVPNKVTQATYSVSSSSGYYLGGESNALTDGINYTRTANPDLKWEVVSQLNFGVDFDLMGGKLYGTLDYFNKTTTDAILLVPAVQPNFSDMWTNIDGEIINKGFEFTLGSNIIKSKDVKWTVDVNGATLNNEVKGLPVTEILSGGVSGSGVSGETVNIYKNGYAAGSFYMLHHMGFDADGNSIYSDDKQITEGALPTFTYGLNTSLSYKNVELTMSLVGQSGAYLFNNTKLATNHMSNLLSSKNVTNDVLNSGQSENDALRVSDYYLESSDYLRLNNLRVAYHFNTSKVEWLEGLTLYASGQNLFTITDYSGYDPSVNTSKSVGGNSSLGMDYASYPSSRTYLFGVNFKF
nr:TonB-dependent receptor [uncultured Carboxylicivirga sp.]